MCDKVVCDTLCVKEEDAEEAGRGGHAPGGADLKTKIPQYFVWIYALFRLTVGLKA